VAALMPRNRISVAAIRMRSMIRIRSMTSPRVRRGRL
jgi:hypothetical protein